MKKTMIMAALIGFTAVSSYAQNETFAPGDSSYFCTKKVVKQKVITIQDVQPTTSTFIYTVPDTALQTETLVPTAALAPRESCYRYQQNNLTVTKCPGTVYKSDDKNVYEYNTDGVYMGYYPIDKGVQQENTTTTCVKVKTAAPRHTIKKWTIPANAAHHKKECSLK